MKEHCFVKVNVYRQGAGSPEQKVLGKSHI